MVGSDEVIVDQSVISAQAREVIAKPYNILDELLTNSSDSLFGMKFQAFFNFLPASDRVPAIPTIEEFETWQEQVKGKYGKITIRPFNTYLEVTDDGGGIPSDYIEKRIRQYSRSADDEIKMDNSGDFHRRGQFSRGLKEVAVAINTHLNQGDATDGEVLIRTVYRKGIKNFEWEGKYYMVNGKAYFTVTHPERETDNPTGTTVMVRYPTGSDNLISRNRLKDYLETNMKLQRIFLEHNVNIEFSKIGIQYILSLFERYRLEPFRTEKIVVSISQSDMKQVLGTDYFEIKVELYQFNRELNQYRSLTKGEISTEMRGIFLHDHTATYGTIDIENNLGTESLQCHVIVPALRVFAVLGVLQSGKFPSLVSSNRKTLNMSHPLLELVEQNVLPIWNEEVEKIAAELRRKQAKRRSKRTTALNSLLENKMSRILKRALAEADQEVPQGIEGSTPAGPITTDGEGLGSSYSSGGRGGRRKTAFFGPQRTAYGEHILVKVGRERDLKIYIHKDLISSRMESLELKANKRIIVDPDLGQTTDYHETRFSPSFKDKGDFYLYSVTLRSSWEHDEPGDRIELEMSLELNAGNPLSELEDVQRLQQMYPDFGFSPNLNFVITDFSKKLVLKAYVDIGAESESNPDSLIEVEWETDDQVKMAADRMERQSNLSYGWTATPSPRIVDGELKTAYTVRIFLKSPFFSGTFDDTMDITDQNESCKSLMATALCSSLAEILIAAKQLTEEEQLATFREYINAHQKTIMEVIYSDDFS